MNFITWEDDARRYGEKIGMDSISRLNRILLEAGKYSEALRVSKDSKYREEMLRKYNIITDSTEPDDNLE